MPQPKCKKKPVKTYFLPYTVVSLLSKHLCTTLLNLRNSAAKLKLKLYFEFLMKLIDFSKNLHSLLKINFYWIFLYAKVYGLVSTECSVV